MRDVKTDFTPNGDRYEFDFKLCTAPKGWAQLDTESDAWYFGIWANPERRQTVNYCEGDLTIITVDTDQEFIHEIRRIADWHNEHNRFKGIDPGLNGDLKQRFVNLGLADLLH